jgi:hypothetical protein
MGVVVVVVVVFFFLNVRRAEEISAQIEPPRNDDASPTAMTLSGLLATNANHRLKEHCRRLCWLLHFMSK